MKISVLGTGNMGKALVKQVAAHVEGQVWWGSRNQAEYVTCTTALMVLVRVQAQHLS